MLPPLDVKLVQVFGWLCASKPEILQRYPVLGEAVLRSYLSRASDDSERDATQSLLDSMKPTSGKIFISVPSAHDYIYRIEKVPYTQHQRVLCLTCIHLTPVKGDDEASFTVIII